MLHTKLHVPALLLCKAPCRGAFATATFQDDVVYRLKTVRYLFVVGYTGVQL